ncbi:MAG: MMPL family transporter [Planctomycetota bacterium]
MHRPPHRISDFLIAWRTPLLALSIVLGAAALVPARRLQFDRSIENMFAPDDPLLAPYRRLKRTFGGNEIVLAVYADDELLHADGRGIRRLAGLSRQLDAVPGVDRVLSLDQPLGLSIVEPNSAMATCLRQLFQGYTHSADGRIAAVVCMLAPESEADVPRREVIERMRRIVEALPQPVHSGMLAGEPVMVVDGFGYLEADGRRLGWASTVLLAAVILLCFRSLRWVIVPVAVVQLALLMTRATMVLSGLRLSMVSSMLTAIVTVVGIATVVHVIVRFRDARSAGLAPPEALSHAAALLAAPVFWACTSTAVGFVSLSVAKVGPVQDFGLMMAVGSMMVLLSVALVLPGLALLGRFDTTPKRAWGEHLLDRQLTRVVGWVERRPKTVGLAALVAAAAAAAGVYRLEVESDFTRNFREESPDGQGFGIVRSYAFVETNLGGAGVWDVILPAPERLDWEYLDRVRHLEDRLLGEVLLEGPDGRPRPGLTKVLSLADAIVAAAPMDPDRLPPNLRPDFLVTAALDVLARGMPAFKQALYGEDPLLPGGHFCRIMLRARERQSSNDKGEIIRQVERISREEFPPTTGSPGAEVTGFFVLLTDLIHSVLRDQWVTFGMATLAIALLMAVAFRSPVLALVALVPNAVPILVVTGLMGWLGLKINMGAAMIAAVSIGLSVDSSIHYITAFRRERDEGATVGEALATVHQSVGRAMVFSILALIVGFTTLSTSRFVPTVYFGALVSLTMLGGLAGNLVVLPLLLKLVTRQNARGKVRS